MEKLTILNAQPGIQKDGTQLDSRSWIDGQHCRFQRGKPRKMGGYQELIGTLNNVPRGTVRTNDHDGIAQPKKI